MPVVADQKPTTGTRAITDGVDLGVGLGVGSGVRIAVAVFVGCGSGVGDGCVGAQDITMATIATAPDHRRAIRDPRMGLA
ncbi:MAG: hypothetical protein A2V84_00700 [Chloroflexi bacterium RBG_16_70_13]|nr:MAG: hypothetical protein A2V84_00700 [Chloroflexi bacterium RBG_16_70_13]